jgi:hypothetical protein
VHTTEQLNTALAGRYSIERRVGEGGMATVYLARDLRHNRMVVPAAAHGDARLDECAQNEVGDDARI